MKRHATAVWTGTGKEGKGHVTTQTGVLDKAQYGFKSRFEDGEGTNPEELIAAAHASCFAMKLSFNLTEADYPPQELNAQCYITFEDGAVKQSKIVVKAQVIGIDEDKFAELVEDAKDNCPISKLLNTDIVVEHTLN